MIKLSWDFANTFKFDPFKIGATVGSKFIPIINAQNIKNIYRANTIGSRYENVLMRSWHKPKPDFLNNRKYTTYERFVEVFNGHQSLHQIILSDTKGVTHTSLVAGKFYITDKESNVLFTMCMRKPEDIVYTNPTRTRGENGENVYIDAEHDEGLKKLVMLVSTELATSEKYKKFWVKFEKDYIQKAYQQEIEVRYMSSSKIEKLCFSNNFKVDYASLNELLLHMKVHIPRIAVMDVNAIDFRNINPSLDTHFVPATEDTEVQSISVDLDASVDPARIREALSGMYQQSVQLEYPDPVVTSVNDDDFGITFTEESGPFPIELASDVTLIDDTEHSIATGSTTIDMANGSSITWNSSSVGTSTILTMGESEIDRLRVSETGRYTMGADTYTVPSSERSDTPVQVNQQQELDEFIQEAVREEQNMTNNTAEEEPLPF